MRWQGQWRGHCQMELPGQGQKRGQFHLKWRGQCQKKWRGQWQVIIDNCKDETQLTDALMTICNSQNEDNK